MARPATAPAPSFWETFAQALGGIALRFTDHPRRQSHLEELLQETDRVRRTGRHWLM